MSFDFSMRSPGVKNALRNRVAGRYPWLGHGRGYEYPEQLIAAIPDYDFNVAARIQYEGGARSEGVGFPQSEFSRSALTLVDLNGVIEDPYFREGRLVGHVKTTEKGGFRSDHYISPATYFDLEQFLQLNGQLKGRYEAYLTALNRAARVTGQFLKGRGTHGLKHDFAYHFIADAMAAGKSHASIMTELAKRCGHHRADVAVTYYAARR